MWLKLDDGFGEHPKIVALSAAARSVHVLGLCYAARNETDGFLPARLGQRIGAKPGPVKELVGAGLWHATTGLPAACLRCADGWSERLGDEHLATGWVIHDFLDYNPSATQLAQKRSEARDRMAKVRSPAAPARPVSIDRSGVVRANG